MTRHTGVSTRGWIRRQHERCAASAPNLWTPREPDVCILHKGRATREGGRMGNNGGAGDQAVAEGPPGAPSRPNQLPGRKGGVFAQRQSLRCLSREHPLQTTPPQKHKPFKPAPGGQSSGPWGPWLPVVQKQPTFRTAHGAPPKYEHHASQTPGITQHTSHAVGPIEKGTANFHGAKSDGTNAWRCLDKGVAHASHCTRYVRTEMVYCSENPRGKMHYKGHHP